MKRYHLTCSQIFYGQKDAKTYYNVPARHVWDKMRFMCNHFAAKTVFVYSAYEHVAHNKYIGSYSAKYDNFKSSAGLSKYYQF